MADNYTAWTISAKDYPKQGTLSEQIQFISAYGTLAPSTHNTQPWVVTTGSTTLEIEPDWSKHLPEADSSGRNLFISLGAHAFNCLIAAAYFGLSTELKLSGADQDHAKIVISFSESQKIDPKLVELFPQLTRRYSDKRVVSGKPIQQAVINQLQSSGKGKAMVYLTADSKAVQTLAELCYKSAASYALHPRFARELSDWLRGNGTAKFDGMPGFMNGLSKPKALIGKTVTRLTSKSLKVLSKKYLKMLQISPAVGIITTDSDDWQAWVQSGLAYERLSLIAGLRNLSLSPVTAPIERPERDRLTKYFTHSSGYPQMFFRLIQAQKDHLHSPRHTGSRQTIELSIVERLKKEGLDISLQSIRVNGYRINYVVSGEGPPLVLIHGANIGWGQWLPNIKALSENFQVIALDLPGCGGSTPVNFRSLSLDVCVETVAALCKELDITGLAVIGHSYGSAIAIKLAQRPELAVTKVVLVNPLGFDRHVPHRQKLVTLFPFAKLLSRTAVKPSRSNMSKFLADPLVAKDRVTAELVDYFWSGAAENSNNHPLLFMNSLTSPFLLKAELLLTNEAAQLRQPLLVIAGEKDPLIPLDKLKKALRNVPKSRLQVLPDTGHVVSLERSREFNELVTRFLT